jgi:hypothetical protein
MKYLGLILLFGPAVLSILLAVYMLIFPISLFSFLYLVSILSMIVGKIICSRTGVI